MGSACAWRSRVSSTAAMPPSRSWRKARSNSIRFMSFGLLGSFLNEVAIQRELADQRIDLAQAQWQCAAGAPDSGARSGNRRRPFPERRRKPRRHARRRTSWPATARPGCGARPLVPALHASPGRARRCASRPCRRAPAAARCPAGFAAAGPASWMRWRPRSCRKCSRNNWPVRGSSSRTLQTIPLHLHAPADPARRRAVVGSLHFHAAIQMHRALAVLVIAERLERQRQQGGLLFGKHGRDLPLGGAVDARVGPPLSQ